MHVSHFLKNGSKILLALIIDFKLLKVQMLRNTLVDMPQLHVQRNFSSAKPGHEDTAGFKEYKTTA